MSQEIVPIKIIEEKPQHKTCNTAKIALKIKAGNLEFEIQNGADKYILYSILKELKNYVD